MLNKTTKRVAKTNGKANNQEDNKNNDVAISENEAIKLLVYPSPATSVINITNAEDGTMVRVFNVNGKVVLDTSLECKQLNISNLEKGIYS